MTSDSLNIYDEDHKEFRYVNETLVLCTYPELGESLDFEDDVCQLAQNYLDNCLGRSVGSYGEMIGIPLIQKDIGDYIVERDGIPMESYDEILIENRQEDLLYIILPIFPGFNCCGTHGMLVPAPVSPSLPQVIECSQFQFFQYYPVEKENRWTITKDVLIEAFNSTTCKIHCLLLENPGYPTGHIYNRTELETFIKFAKEYKVVLIAIENLQMDIYEEKSESDFLSMRKVLLEMGPSYSEVQLISMFSPNRSALGQPGYSVSFLDSVGMDKMLWSMGNAAFNTAPTLNQIYLSIFLRPARIRNDPSFKRYNLERKKLKHLLLRLSGIATEFLRNIEYMSCSTVKAGQTVFPRIDFPKKWLAGTNGKAITDLEKIYCEQLKKETGIHVTPGNVFGQTPGTLHFKLNIPFDEDELLKTLKKIESFHKKFCNFMEE